MKRNIRFSFLLLAILLSVLGLQTNGLAAPRIPLPTAAMKPSATTETPPEGLGRSDWSGIRAAHEGWKHRFQRDEDGSFTAHNPGQQWESSFDGRGFLARPDQGAWEWGLELQSYGIGGESVAVETEAEGRAESGEEARLVYRRDALLEEWFRNDTRGLEQGWTLSERPGGADDEKLSLDLAVRGGLSPEVADGGLAVRFVDDAGAAALTYGGLKAWDAEGRVLEARFVPNELANNLRIEVDEREAVYPVTIDPVARQAYLKASNTEAGDLFGVVSVDGDTVVVGAPSEDSAATGVNGDENDNSADGSGAVYVFVRSGSGWLQQAYLKASNTEADDRFGGSVSVSGDTIVVGASGEDSFSTWVDIFETDNSADESGAAYVFTRSGSTWSQQAYLKPFNTDANDGFGTSVSVSGDTVVVGTVREDSAATGVNGDGSDNSAMWAGAAYVFTRAGITWSQEAYLKPLNTEMEDVFGRQVSVDGDTVVVGAALESSAATGVNGDGSDNSIDDSGAVYVFVRNGTTWSQQAYLKASNTGGFDHFGRSVSVSGDTVVVGASNERSADTGVDGDELNNSANQSGAAYIFVRSGTVWSQQAYLKPSNTGEIDQFGWSVSVSGDTVAVGAISEDSAATGVDGDGSDNSASSSGAAYVFSRSGTTWSQQAYLKAFNTDADDRFGVTVSVSGNTLVIGATGEDSNASGANGPDNNSAETSGAAYTFLVSTPPSTTPSETARPVVKILKKKSLKSSRPRHRVKGSATDNVAVALVEVKTAGNKGWKKAKLKASGRWVYRTPRLRPGNNTIKIRAVDTSGNRSKITRVKARGR